MPLAERDVNLQHQLPLTRGKRLPTAGSVTDENSAPSPSIPRAKTTPTQPQRFLAPTKASVAKNTPPPSVDRTRAQPHLGRSTPLSQPHTSGLPRRNTATPTPKAAFSPLISRWNASAAPIVVADSSPDNQRSSPPPSPCGRAVSDQGLVRRACDVANLDPTHMFPRSPLTVYHAVHNVPVPVSRSHYRHVQLLHSSMRQALHGTAAA